MLQDRVTLGAQLLGRHGHAHLDVLDFPLGPCTAIHPDAALLQPLGTGALLLVDGGEYGVSTLAVGAMRVGKVAGHVDLVGLDIGDELLHDGHILLRHGQLLNLTTLVERQVEEVYAIERNLAEGAGRTGFATTDETLDGQDVARVEIAFFLLGQEILDFSILRVDHLVLAFAKDLVEAIDEMHEAGYLLIAHSNIARCLIGHMHLVSLCHESLQRATHRDDIVVGMRREDDHTLRERLRTLRTIGVVGIGLTTRPASDGML